MNIPNLLTLFRILLVPILVIVFFLPYTWSFYAAALIFIIASITDFFDGFLARKLEQQTSFGAVCDPVADKLIISIVLILLVAEYKTIFFTLPAIIIVGREIVVSGLREWMSEIGKRTNVSVSLLGKIKTVFQMVSIIILLYGTPEHFNLLVTIGFVFLYISVFLTLWSMVLYIKAAWPHLWSSSDELVLDNDR
tara:strand:+ start:791 stop:1372 length:582 start_codon:yes stop_codon:yes gene_type:complete